MHNHKYDKRGAANEGQFAEQLYDKICPSTHTTKQENCQGVDRIYQNKKIDIKARKNKIPPHTTWIELAAANKPIGSGWAYKDKHIAQLMIYEQNKTITNAIFGEYHTKDLIILLNQKVNFNSKATYGKTYEVYTRYTNKEHRGSMTVITYQDLESLPSFICIDIPQEFWPEIREFYGYN